MAGKKVVFVAFAIEDASQKTVRGIWAYADDRTNLVGVNTVVWTWANIAAFINSL
jgi:hypothetical protein